MSQNHHTPRSDCAAFAPLLPLAGHDLLSEEEDARLRSHLATCAHCRAELSIYNRVEEALRQAFAPRPALIPLFSREELMQTLDDHPDNLVPAAPAPVPIAPERKARRFLGGLSALAATLVIAVLAVSIFATHRGGINATPAPARGSQRYLSSISMVSPTEGWAAGYEIAPPPKDASGPTALLMHYTRGAWSTIHTTFKGMLNSISMVSATDGWAVGIGMAADDAGMGALILHYDGHTWQQLTSPVQRGVANEMLYSVQMLSATDGWLAGNDPYAGGGDYLDDGPVIGHYDGQDWSGQPPPASLNVGPKGNILNMRSLSMLSATEGWAVGTLTRIGQPDDPASLTTPPAAVILHYTGGQWEVQSRISGAVLLNVSMTSSTDGWAVGYTITSISSNAGGTPGVTDNTAPLLLHYTGGAWVKVASPLTTSGSSIDMLLQVNMRSASDGWLISGVDRKTGIPALFHYNGSRWSAARIPTFTDTKELLLNGITMTSAAEGWAVGARFSNADRGVPNAADLSGYTPTVTPVILHYLNGAWSVYQS
jgi:hypothetical protein